MLKIEDLLLQTLHFDVSTVSTHTFLLHYLKLADVDEVTGDLARVRRNEGRYVFVLLINDLPGVLILRFDQFRVVKYIE